MPTPDQLAKFHEPSPAMRDALDRMIRPTTAGELIAEVAALREEIAALRRELAPVPSLILTGREVVEQFKRLTA